MQDGFASISHGIAYVIADDANEAYQILKYSLEKRNLGYSKDRELSKVELIAEETSYPDCGTSLYT
jgi:hypothetical protein